MPTTWKYKYLWFVYNSTFGLFFGIQWLWYLDKYKALFEIGKQYNITNKYKLIIGDLVYHLTPLIITQFICHKLLKSGLNQTVYNPYGSGIITGLMHITYSYMINGKFDPSDLYMIKTRSQQFVDYSRLGIIIAHCCGELVLRLNTIKSCNKQL